MTTLVDRLPLAVGAARARPGGFGGRRALRLIERSVMLYRRTPSVLISGAFEPFFYLVGHRLRARCAGRVAAGPRTARPIPYGAFVAPGLLAASAMNGAMFEATLNFFFKLRYQKLYDAILSTPLGVGDVAVGEVGWALMRGALYATSFIVIAAALGLILSPLAILAIPGALLIGFAFGAVGMAVSSFMRSWQDFDLVQLVTAADVPVLGHVLPALGVPAVPADDRPADAAVPRGRARARADDRSRRPGEPGERRLPRGDGAARAGDRGAAPAPAPAEVTVDRAAAARRRARAGRGGDRQPRRSDATPRRAVVSECRLCPRLVAWREESAAHPPARFAGQRYWARPVPGWGDPAASVLLVGLAPAAHGGNRTGRIFTGDRSGDFLFPALFRAGFANQPTSTHAGDGLRLLDLYVGAVNRCAPPANRPTPEERDTCLPYLVRELELLPTARVVVALGAFAWDGFLRAAARRSGSTRPVAAPGRGSGTAPRSRSGRTGSSARSTSASRTPSPASSPPPMLDAVFARARELAGPPPSDGVGHPS